jgi:hypothetical protein
MRFVGTVGSFWPVGGIVEPESEMTKDASSQDELLGVAGCDRRPHFRLHLSQTLFGSDHPKKHIVSLSILSGDGRILLDLDGCFVVSQFDQSIVLALVQMNFVTDDVLILKTPFEKQPPGRGLHDVDHPLAMT